MGTAQEQATAQATAPSMAARARELEEKNNSFWKPEPGDSIGGKLVSVDENVGKNGDSRIYTIEDETDGSMVSMWGSAVLDRELGRLGARPGDLVGIKYFGKKATKGGQEYKAYAVDVVKQAFTDDVPF